MGSRRKLDIVVDAEYNGGSEITSAANSIERLGLESDIAAQKQAAFNAKSKELAAEVARGGKTIDQATDELKQYGDELERTALSEDKLDGAAGKASGGMAGLAAGVAVATGAIVAVGAAAKIAYDTINEGAALGAAAGKFDNLSASINTTGDALLGKMREATKGMISDAELVAAGTDIMNLGLSKTEGGVVRMSAAVGALNLDMGVLAMTLANDSVMRLDALGLAMEDVNNTKKELISSGFIGDAFDEAVLIELEKKMVLLGDASLTTAGQLKQVETEWKNVTDEMKKNAAEGAGPVVSWMSKGIDQANLLEDALAKGVITNREYNISSANLGAGLLLNDGLLADITQRVEAYDAEVAIAIETAATYTAYQKAVADSLNDTSDALVGYVGESLYATQAQEAAIASTHAYIAAQLESEASAIIRAAATEKVTETILAARDAELEATAAMGDYFTAALDVIGTSGDLTQNAEAQNSALYASADAAGASATELALLGLATGDLTAAQAEAALKSAAMQVKIEELGVALANGMDPAAAMASVQDFAEELNNTDFSVQLGLQLEETEGKTREKQDEVVKGLEGISAASFTTGSDLTSMSSQGVTDLETLRASFDINAESVDRNATAVGKLKDLIIDGLPNEKIVNIKVKITQEGSWPQIPGEGATGPGSGGIPSAVSDALGG